MTGSFACCDYRSFEFFKIVIEDNTLIKYLQDHKLILSNKSCDICKKNCKLHFERGLWRCSKVFKSKRIGRNKCTFTSSIYKNNFFSNARLEPFKVLIFIYNFVHRNFSLERVKSDIGASNQTFCDWSSFCREVCVYISYDSSQLLGGEGIIVEIDEAKFGKRKYNRGRLIEGQWCFGGFERVSKKTFFVPVES
jgi:hypothetical protein